jgi:aspartate aminotransferase
MPPVKPHLHPSTSNPYRLLFENMHTNEAAELLRYGKSKPNCISLAQGEGTLSTPPFICEAATKAMMDGKTFYGFSAGLQDLRQEISTYHARIYQKSIPLNRIIVTSSGTNAVHLALMSILDDDDEVVAVTPIWKNLIGITELVGGRLIEVAMTLDKTGWQLDLEKLFDAVTHKTKAIMIVSPNNPTGWMMSADDIKTVMEFARERGIWVIADEVYGRTPHHLSRAPSFLDVAEDDDLLYVVNSFSKTWAMTGWRLGWLIGPQSAELKIRDIILYETMGPPTFTQYAGITALRHGEDFLDQQKTLWRNNQNLVNDYFSPLQEFISFTPSDTAFYSFFKINGCSDSCNLAKYLIDEAGVSLTPGGAFGDGFGDYLRLCYAVNSNVLEEALNRLIPHLKPCKS